jgi:PAS domain-containing protein
MPWSGAGDCARWAGSDRRIPHVQPHRVTGRNGSVSVFASATFVRRLFVWSLIDMPLKRGSPRTASVRTSTSPRQAALILPRRRKSAMCQGVQSQELTAANEQLQSANEKLSTVNDELQRRNTELTALNEALARGEDRFRLMVEGVKEYAIYMLDPHGYVTSWNEGARRLTGYEAHEVLGEHYARFFPPSRSATACRCTSWSARAQRAASRRRRCACARMAPTFGRMS